MKAIIVGTLIYIIIMVMSAAVFIYTNDFNKAVVFAIVSSIVWVSLIWTIQSLSDRSSR